MTNKGLYLVAYKYATVCVFSPFFDLSALCNFTAAVETTSASLKGL